MNFRRADLRDRETIQQLLEKHTPRSRFHEIVAEAINGKSNEYLAAVADDGGRVGAVAAYGLIAGTLGTAALHGVVPVTRHATGLLSFAAHELQSLGAKQVIAEFPDTDEYKPYRDVLLESGFDPTGLVEDFYRDGTAMVILTRKLG